MLGSAPRSLPGLFSWVYGTYDFKMCSNESLLINVSVKTGQVFRSCVTLCAHCMTRAVELRVGLGCISVVIFLLKLLQSCIQMAMHHGKNFNGENVLRAIRRELDGMPYACYSLSALRNEENSLP